MKTLGLRLSAALGVLVVGAGAAWIVVPSLLEDEPESYAGAAQPESDACCPEEHEHRGSVDGLDLSELESLRCEHETPTFRCSECRYEVGVVRVDASLLEAEGEGRSPLVETASVRTGSIPREVAIPGTVELDENHSAHIGPRIPGAIQSVAVDVGAEVQKDDVLFEITSVELGRALSDYEKSRALLALSRKSLEREESLFEKRIATERSLIDARMAYEQRLAELAAAEHTLVALGMSREDIASVSSSESGAFEGRLKVRAPFAGTIVEKHAVVGELVEPSRPVLLLSDLRKVWVWADVYGRDLAPLLEAQSQGPTPVSIAVAELPSRVFEGAFDYFGATMDPGTRTVKARATVENPGGLLRPGMFCSVTARLPGSSDGMLVPAEAVLEDEGSLFVFRHLTEDLFVRSPVEIGARGRDWLQVVSGLEGDETVVSRGAFLLKSDVLREKMGAGCAD